MNTMIVVSAVYILMFLSAVFSAVFVRKKFLSKMNIWIQILGLIFVFMVSYAILYFIFAIVSFAIYGWPR